MSNTRDDRWQGWDDTAEREPAARSAGGRRVFVRGAAGGLALAAGGLFLPAWLEEAEAREGANGGELGGRRSKDRRGRDNHKRRTHGDKKEKGKDDAPPKGHGPFRSTALTVTNKTSQPLNCTFYYRVKTGLDDYDKPVANGTRTLGLSDSYRYDPDRYRVAVLIKEINPGVDLYADVRNVSYWYPRGGVNTGANLNPGNSNTGTALIAEQNFAEGEEQTNGKVVLQRRYDSADRIEWELIIGGRR